MNYDDIRKEMLDLGERMLDLYHKLPQNGSMRKILAGRDKKGRGNNIVLFQGSEEDGFAVQEFLNSRPKK